MEDRATILLTAVKELLRKQKEAGILTDHPITVHYDEADCDGYCLLDDITAFLEEYNKLKGERADGLTEDNIDTE
jgi:hypothetical protein